MSEERNCWKCHWCWLGRCMGCNRGLDVSVTKNQPKDCKEYITKEEWNRTHVEPLSQKRCMELLNAMIENLHVAESNITVIKHLLYVGFTEDELVNHFNYSRDDVKDALEGMDDYEDNIIIT